MLAMSKKTVQPPAESPTTFGQIIYLPTRSGSPEPAPATSDDLQHTVIDTRPPFAADDIAIRTLRMDRAPVRKTLESAGLAAPVIVAPPVVTMPIADPREAATKLDVRLDGRLSERDPDAPRMVDLRAQQQSSGVVVQVVRSNRLPAWLAVIALWMIVAGLASYLGLAYAAQHQAPAASAQPSVAQPQAASAQSPRTELIVTPQAPAAPTAYPKAVVTTHSAPKPVSR